jgi:transcriptional regulator with XRE-family HTH domain
MENFENRLKEERERLGLSQAKVAEACGVGKTAQYTYESGERKPSFDYLIAAEKLGMDSRYLLLGHRETAPFKYKNYSYVLSNIVQLLGLDSNQLNKIAEKYGVVEAKKDYLLLHADEQIQPEQLAFMNLTSEVADWLLTSTTPDALFDFDLLTTVLAEVDAYQSTSRVKLTPQKKSQAIVVLYRAFKASGKIDQPMIEDTVKLAAS